MTQAVEKTATKKPRKRRTGRVPSDRTEVLQLRVTPEELRMAHEVARKRDLTVSQLLRAHIRDEHEIVTRCASGDDA